MSESTAEAWKRSRLEAGYESVDCASDTGLKPRC